MPIFFPIKIKMSHFVGKKFFLLFEWKLRTIIFDVRKCFNFNLSKHLADMEEFMKAAKKKKTWTKPHHKHTRNLLYMVLAPYTKLRYKIEVVPFKEQGNRPYMIIMNHQTGLDQFFVAMTFKGPVYYVATEDLFSKGWISSVIRFLVEPIPIKKQTNDTQAVRNIIRVAREGGTIALAPEGNRTYSGRTEYIKPAIAGLVRVSKLPLAILRIEGGYGVQPRWSDVVRKGKMRSYVSRVVEYEEYKSLSDDELYELIKDALYVDEYAIEGNYYHRKSAEYLERAMYVCPYCGLSEFESHGDTIECKKCGRKIKYLPSKELKGVGFDFPYKNVGEWYDYQNDFINSLNNDIYTKEPLYTDVTSLSEVILNKCKKPIKSSVKVSLYGDRMTIDDLIIPFDDTYVVTVLGKNKLNIYYNDKVYQLKGNKRFNALKYVNIFYRYKNIREDGGNGKFLGI